MHSLPCQGPWCFSIGPEQTWTNCCASGKGPLMFVPLRYVELSFCGFSDDCYWYCRESVNVIYCLIFCNSQSNLYNSCGGAVASWLVRSTPERALRVRALAGDIVLCSWARHFTLTVPLSTQVYKWVQANLILWVTL